MTSRTHTFHLSGLVTGLLIVLATPSALAQIFSCIDPHGRKLTSDRPITECLGKEQKELNPSGTVKRIVKPVMTAEERRAAEAAQEQERTERSRQEEVRRKNRALLARYPNKAAHDKDRNQALAKVDELITDSREQLAALMRERSKVGDELLPFRVDPSKAPTSLKQKAESTEQAISVQQNFLGEHERERQRISARFDDELLRLEPLWTQLANARAAATDNSTAKK